MGNLLLIEPTELHYYDLKRVAAKYCDNVIGITESIKKKAKIEDLMLVNFDDIDSIIKNCKPDFVYTFSESAVKLCEKISKKYNLHYCGLLNTSLYRDKVLMKKAWEDESIKVPKMRYYDSVEQILIESETLNFPFILKSNCSFSSNGVYLVNNLTELKRHLNSLQLINKIILSKVNINKKIMVEEYIGNGEEYSVDIIWKDGRTISTIIMKKEMVTPPYFLDRLYRYENTDSNVNKNLVSSAISANKALGIRDGATHTEIIVLNDEYYLIESAYRPGGSGIIYKVASYHDNVDYFEVFYRTVIRNDDMSYAESLSDSERSFFHYVLPYENSGRFDRVEGLEKIKDRCDISEIYVHAIKGDYLPPESMNGGNRCCTIIGSIPRNGEIKEWLSATTNDLKVKFQGES